MYRLPCSCHAGSLIPAVRFFREEKSSLLRAGDFLRRTRVPAQSGIVLPIGMYRWGDLYSRGNPSTTAAPSEQRRSPLPYVPSERMTRGLAGMPPSGGSPDWGIPCVAQCFLPAESMSVAGHARDFLRRSPCPARRAEFFLYEKMGRRAIDHEGSISEAGSNQSIQTCPHNPKKFTGSKGI